MTEFLKFALRRSTVFRALRVALLITPILTVLNHFEALMELDIGWRFLAKVAMTFTVPYLVSTYSSAMAAREQHHRDVPGA